MGIQRSWKKHCVKLLYNYLITKTKQNKTKQKQKTKQKKPDTLYLTGKKCRSSEQCHIFKKPSGIYGKHLPRRWKKKTIFSSWSILFKVSLFIEALKNFLTSLNTQVSSLAASSFAKSSATSSYMDVKTWFPLAPLANIGRISGLPQDHVYLLSLKVESNSTGFSFQPRKRKQHIVWWVIHSSKNRIVIWERP